MNKPNPDEKAYAMFEAFQKVKSVGNEGHNRDTESDEFLKLISDYDWSDTIFVEDGKVGVKNAGGQVIIPAEYDSCPRVYNPAIYRPTVMVLVKGDRYYVVKTDGSGELSIPQGFKYAYITSIFDLIAKNDDDKYGLITPGSKIIIPFEMDEIYDPTDRHIIFRKDGKYGISDINGIYGLYVEPKFDDIESLSDDDTVIFKARLGDKWGYIAHDGNFTVSEEDALTIELN